MSGVFRTRIDQRKPIMAKDKCVRAGEGVGRGIGCSDPHNAIRNGDGLAGLRVEIGREAKGWSRAGHCAYGNEKVRSVISGPDRPGEGVGPYHLRKV